MLEILEYIVSILTNDATLLAIVPKQNILVGPPDMISQTQTQTGLLLPQINVRVISEVSRSVPANTRDSVIQIDIWTRNSQLELENIYERVITLLNYQTANQNTAHIFWDRLDSGVDLYESDRRIFHKACSYRFWTTKP